MYYEALKRPFVREMDFTGRPMKGFLFIGPAGIKTDDELTIWLNVGIEFVKKTRAKKEKNNR